MYELKILFLDANSEIHEAYSSCAFHPDGLLLGTCTVGASNALRIWDIREQQNVATLIEHTAAVKCVAFSENGYLVATGSDDSLVKIWDLRKLKCTSSLETAGGSVNSVSFDYSGNIYLFL